MGKNKDLQIEDVPKEMLEQIKTQFEAAPQVREQRVAQQLAQRHGNYLKALEIGMKLDTVYNKTVTEYLKMAKAQSRKIKIENLGLSKEDGIQVKKCIFSLFMTCDIIESAIIDIDEVLHKYDKDVSFEFFNDIKELTKHARTKLQYLQKESKVLNDIYWGDKCDDMYRLMLNKAGALLRKLDKDDV